MTRAARANAARSARSVLIVAGEASGDRIAARIARALHTTGARCFGMGGPASAAAGVRLVADLRRSTAMGLTEVAAQFPAVALAFARLVAAARATPPHAAVLVDYTEFNLRIGVHLKRKGIPVLWCVAPQVWAWRPRRTATVSRALDRLAVILPFEERLWREAGVDAHYIGHPALDTPLVDRGAARTRLGLGAARPTVAILPGSRSHEVRRHAEPMFAALAELSRAGMRVDARVLAASSLDSATHHWLGRIAERAGVPVVDMDGDASTATYLAAFDGALAASGTVTLECALAGAPPVIVYRLSPLTAVIARRVVRTPFIGLPNIVLGESVYPELIDGKMQPRAMARALASVLERRTTFEPRAHELRARLAWPAAMSSRAAHPAYAALSGATSAERAASLLSDWLGDERAPQVKPLENEEYGRAPRDSLAHGASLFSGPP